MRLGSAAHSPNTARKWNACRIASSTMAVSPAEDLTSCAMWHRASSRFYRNPSPGTSKLWWLLLSFPVPSMPRSYTRDLWPELPLVHHLPASKNVRHEAFVTSDSCWLLFASHSGWGWLQMEWKPSTRCRGICTSLRDRHSLQHSDVGDGPSCTNERAKAHEREIHIVGGEAGRG